MCGLQWFWFPILRDDQNGFIVETKRKIATELICQSSDFLFSLWRSGTKAPGLVGYGNCLYAVYVHYTCVSEACFKRRTTAALNKLARL